MANADIMGVSPALHRILEEALMEPLFRYDFGMAQPPSPAPSISTPQGIAQALGALDKGADLSPITERVKQCEAEHRARIEKDLAGLADLELLSGAKSRRFVLAYWQYDEARIAYGTEYSRQKSESEESATVFVYGIHFPLSTSYRSMAKLSEYLQERNIPYRIAYYDN